MPIEVGMEQLVATVGSGAVLGGIAGFAAKKLVKLAAVIVVLEAGLLAVLERNGVLNVHWSALDGFLASTVGSVESGLLGAVSLVAALPIGAGLAGGFLAGFKIA
jgi:uncharacterized membrane protein (Fun14 family)